MSSFFPSTEALLDLAPPAVPPATDLGRITSLRQVTGQVNQSSGAQTYQIQMNAGRLSLELTGMTADADLEVLDSQFQTIAFSGQAANLNERLELQNLTAGTYYVRINPYTGNTNYTLSLLGNVLPPNDRYESNNTIVTAFDLGRLSGSQSIESAIGLGDEVDYYKILVQRRGPLSLSLTGLQESRLQGDLDLQLFQDTNLNQRLDDRDWSRLSRLPGKSQEWISETNLAPGTYWIRVFPSGNVSSSYRLTINAPIVQAIDQFSIVDASGDDTPTTVLSNGALRINYQILGVDASYSLRSVQLLATPTGASTTVPSVVLGNWTQSSMSNGLLNLTTLPNLTAGSYQISAIVTFQDGKTLTSGLRSLQVNAWTPIRGTAAPDVLNYGPTSGINEAIVWGLGGTDTLNLSFQKSAVVSLNGRSLGEYQPLDAVRSQAIFGGTAFDYLRLQNGNQIYFQGIESLRFLDGTVTLQMQTNDPGFASQWNLRASDVESAWRFTRGSSRVMIVSLDTGVLTAIGGVGGVEDLRLTQLITDESDDDDYLDSGHGHRALSIMSATANNQTGITGINWRSSVMIQDLYGGSKLNSDRKTLYDALSESLSYARSRNLKVVFQGGIQGEFWLNDGALQNELDALIAGSAKDAFYAIAAGNGNVDLDVTDEENSSVMAGTSGGVARLQARYGNLASVGAVVGLGQSAFNGLQNATSFDRAGYSNYGKNLTLSATTNLPAIDKFGSITSFGGTSAANPMLAGIASLVWSINPNLTGAEIRQILVETAIDLGATGRDDFYGAGLVNADAAVRRAYALSRDRALALMGKPLA